MLSLPDKRFVRTIQAPQQITWDDTIEGYRVSSAAYDPTKQDKILSGDLEELLADDGLPPDALFDSQDRAVAATAIPVETLRSLGVTCEHDPVWSNWYHGAVKGEKLRKVKPKIAAAAQVLRAVDQEEAERQEIIIRGASSRVDYLRRKAEFSQINSAAR